MCPAAEQPWNCYSQTPCYERKIISHWVKQLLMVFCHLQPKAFLTDLGVPALCSEFRSACLSPLVFMLTRSPHSPEQSVSGHCIRHNHSLPWSLFLCKTMTHLGSLCWPHTFIPEQIPRSMLLCLSHFTSLFLFFVKCHGCWPGYKVSVHTHTP